MSRDDDDYEDEWGTILDDENFEQLDREVTLSGTYDDRPDEAPYDGAKYHATDVNAVFAWDAAASEWTVLNSGTATDPIPGTVNLESLRVGDLHTDGRVPSVLAIERDSEWIAIDSDGVVESGTDPHAILQAAVDATPSGAVLFIEGDWTVTDPVAVKQDIEIYGPDAYIRNEHVIQSGDWEKGAIDVRGDESGTVDLTANAASGDTTISVGDASQIRESDILAVRSDRPVHPDSDESVGEVVAVRDVDRSSDEVELEEPLFESYQKSNDAHAWIIHPVSAKIRGLTIEAAGNDAHYENIAFRYAKDCKVEDCDISKGRRCVRSRICHNVMIADSRIGEAGNHPAYGLSLHGTHQRITNNCYLYDCRHLVSAGGGFGIEPRDVVLCDSTCLGNMEGATIDSHNEVHTFRVENCLIKGPQRAIQSGARKTFIGDCDVVVTGGPDDVPHGAIDDRGTMHDADIQIVSTDIEASSRYAIDLGTVTSYSRIALEDIVVRNEDETEGWRWAVSIRPTDTVDVLDVDGLTVQSSGNTSNGVRFGDVVGRATINDLKVEGSAGHGVSLFGTNGYVDISNATVHEPSQAGDYWAGIGRDFDDSPSVEGLALSDVRVRADETTIHAAVRFEDLADAVYKDTIVNAPTEEGAMDISSEAIEDGTVTM